MINSRTFWWLALIMMLFWLFIQWQNFLIKKQQGELPTESTSQTEPEKPLPNVGETPNIPVQQTQQNKNNVGKQSELPAIQTNQDNKLTNDTPSSKDLVSVETDVYKINLSKIGGDIRNLQLLNYPVTVDEPDVPFTLLDDKQLYYIAQSGWVSNDDRPSPTHQQQFTTSQNSFQLNDKETLQVPFYWQANGLSVVKTYEFTAGSYLVKIHYDITNQTETDWSGSMYSQIIRNQFDNTNSSRFVYSYTGPAIFTQEDKYQKHDFDDLESTPIKTSTQGGWIGMLQHYFLAVAVPNQAEQNSFYSRVLNGGLYQVGTVSNLKTVPKQQTQRFTTEFVLGPKIQYDLEEIAEGLDLTVDYGFLTIVAQPIYWTLSKIQSLVINWGVAIILLTLLIKVLFYKLSETSYRSMARMRELGPKLKQLKERYGDDKAQFQKRMMAMYKEQKINPMGGCLPILLQMPVFIALYWVLLESVELRQAPFIWWITDMSQRDPYFVLPIIMGLSMLVQQKLNPAPLEDIQRRVMQILPFAMTIFFMFFPSGLVLYWVTNNILAILQQWYITRKIRLETEAKKLGKAK